MAIKAPRRFAVPLLFLMCTCIVTSAQTAPKSIKLTADGHPVNRDLEGGKHLNAGNSYASAPIPLPAASPGTQVYLKFWMTKQKANPNDPSHIPLTPMRINYNDDEHGGTQHGQNVGRGYDGNLHLENHQMFTGNCDDPSVNTYYGYSTEVTEQKAVWFNKAGQDFLYAGPFDTATTKQVTIRVTGNGDGGKSGERNMKFGFDEPDFTFQYEWLRTKP
ncbi:MAG: hypothetical protein ABL967_20370 [Bryobacteraceae bacterium]